MTAESQRRASSLLSDAVGGIFLRIAAFAAAYVVTIVLARVLGTSDFGSYSFYLTSAILISFPLHLGLSTLLLREVSVAASAQSWSKVWGFISQANRLALIGSMVAWVLLAALFFLAGHGDLDKVPLVVLAALFIPVYALCALRAAVLRANHLPVAGQIPDQLIRPVVVIVLVLAFNVSGIKVDATLAMFLTVVATFIGFTVGHWILKRRLPSRPQALDVVKIGGASWAAFSLLAGATIINSSIGVIYLGVFGSQSEVGLFRVAEQTSLLVAFVLGAVNLVLAPKIARLFSGDQIDILQRLLMASSQLSLVAAIPAFIFFAALGRDFVSVVFGPAYDRAFPLLMVLALGQVVSSLAGSVALVLNMSGNERITLRVSAAGAAINLLSCVLLYPIFGIIGTAIASALSTIFWNLTLAYLVHRRLGVNCTAFGPVRLKSFMESN